MSVVEMRIIDVDDYYFPKVSVVGQQPRRSSSLPLLPQFTIMEGQRSSFSMLPEEPLNLSILKLDGSSFDIEVIKSATVEELRQAVEAVFSHMPQKGPGKISWPHVWSHFCLMFEGQKLLTETDYIGYYGIRDGDQLQFIRHISTSYSVRKKRSMKRIAASEKHRISLSSPYIYEEKEHDDKEDDCYDAENGGYNDNNDIDNIFKHKESRWAGFIQRLFPYSRLPTSERSLKGVSSPSRSACGILNHFSKMIHFCGDSHYSQRTEWRVD